MFLKKIEFENICDMIDYCFSTKNLLICYSNLLFKKIDRKRKSNKRRSNSNHRRAGSFRSHKTDQSNGGNRPRGSLSKVLEKYMTMAQDANANGDRIVAENYYQYAEHYQRLINQSGEQKKVRIMFRIYTKNQLMKNPQEQKELTLQRRSE